MEKGMNESELEANEEMCFFTQKGEQQHMRELLMLFVHSNQYEGTSGINEVTAKCSCTKCIIGQLVGVEFGNIPLLSWSWSKHNSKTAKKQDLWNM